MTRSLITILFAAIAVPFVAGAAVARNAQACTLCLEMGNAVTNCGDVSVIPPAIECLCKPESIKALNKCTAFCEDTLHLDPETLCAKEVLTSARQETANECSDNPGPDSLCGKQAVSREVNTQDSSDMACDLCWETAQAQAHAPLCVGLFSMANVSECLCTAGNVENFSNCNAACVDVPHKQPSNICSASRSPLHTLTTAMPTSNSDAAQITAYPEVKHVARSRSFAPHRSMGGYFGPCGVPGAACGFSVDGDSSEITVFENDEVVAILTPFTPGATVTTSLGSGFVTRTAYLPETGTPIVGAVAMAWV